MIEDTTETTEEVTYSAEDVSDFAISEAIANFGKSEEEAPAEPEAPQAESQPTEEVGSRSRHLAQIARLEREKRELAEKLESKERSTESETPESPKGPFDGVDLRELTPEERYALSTYEILGEEDTPAELLQTVERIKLNLRFKQLESARQEPEKGKDENEIPVEVRAEFAVIQREVRSWVSAGLDSGYELLSAAAQDDPDDVTSNLNKLIAVYYDKKGKFLPMRDAAKLIEEQLVKEAEKYDRLRGRTRTAKPSTKSEARTIEAPISEAEANQRTDREAIEYDYTPDGISDAWDKFRASQG